MKTASKPQPVKLVNPLNAEVWYCENYTDTKFIDGVEYVKVRKLDQPRAFLMRKESLQKTK